MKVIKLSLKNFRGFRKTKVNESEDELKKENESEDENDIEQKTKDRNKKKEEIEVPIDIEFPSEPNIIVLLGVNGSGKSSILDALGTLLFQFVRVLTHDSDPEFFKNEIFQTNEHGKILYESFQRNFILKSARTLDSINVNYNDIHVRSKKPKSLSIDIECEVSNNQKLTWGILSEEAKESDQNLRNTYNVFELNEYGDEFYKQIERKDIPILAYYQIDRIAIDKLKSKTDIKYLHNQFYAYEGAFDKGINDFSHFLYWFENKESRENEAQVRGSTENNSFPNLSLKVVRYALEIFLSHIPEASFKNPRMERGELENEYSFEKPFSLVFTKETKIVNSEGIEEIQKETLKLEQLSSGEKTILMLVGDIARRISIANPELLKQQGVEYTLKNATGIVLIDEIELHLHPKWQTEVLNALHKTFPKVQFIVTTHSPLVLRGVPNDSYRIIHNNEIYSSQTKIKGRDVNSILFEVFGVDKRPIEIEKQINRFYGLLEENKIQESEEILAQLTDLMGDSDIEIVRMNSYLDFERE